MRRWVWLLLVALDPAHGALAEATSDVAEEEVAAEKQEARQDEGFLLGELHYSILTDLSERSTLAPAFGYALKGGYRWGRWGIFAQFEQNMWVATELDTEVVLGAFNIGVGAEVSYFNGHARTSLAFGPSVLAFDTALDEAGNVGIFLDIRPIGVKWDIKEHFRLGLDPLSYAMVAPVLDGIPLVQIEYRTTFWMEGTFR
jgi:hypothetical protein